MNPYRELAPGGEEEKGASDDKGNYHTRATVQSNQSIKVGERTRATGGEGGMSNHEFRN